MHRTYFSDPLRAREFAKFAETRGHPAKLEVGLSPAGTNVRLQADADTANALFWEFTDPACPPDDADVWPEKDSDLSHPDYGPDYGGAFDGFTVTSDADPGL